MGYLEHKQKHSYKKGDYVFHQGDDAGSMFIVQSGELEAFIIVNKRKIILSTFVKGSVFGEMALVDNSPRSATVQAITDCTCTEMSRMNFNKRLEDIPGWMKSFYQILVERLRDTNRRIDTLSSVDRVRQIIYLISNKFLDVEPNKLGLVSIPWIETIKEFSFILNYPKKHIEGVFVKLAISPLAKGKIGEGDVRMLMTDKLDELREFAKYCEEQYFISIGDATDERESISEKMLEFMDFIKSLLKKQAQAEDIDKEFLIEECKNITGKSLDDFKREMSELLKKNVMEKKRRESGSVFYNVDRKRLLGKVESSEKNDKFIALEEKLSQ